MVLALTKDALIYINSSSKFNEVEKITLCTGNALNSGSTAVARSLPLMQLSNIDIVIFDIVRGYSVYEICDYRYTVKHETNGKPASKDVLRLIL